MSRAVRLVQTCGMSIPDAKPPSGCACGCPRCGSHEPEPEASGMSGWPFVVRCAAVFLAPIATAVAGAAWAGPGRAAQAVGAVVGLALGALGAWAALRRFKAGRGS